MKVKLDISYECKKLIEKIVSENHFKNTYERIEDVIMYDENCEHYIYNFNKLLRVERIIDKMSSYSLCGTLEEVRRYINNPNWKDTYKIRKEYDYDDFEYIIIDEGCETDEEYIKRVTDRFHKIDEYIIQKEAGNAELIKEKEVLLKRLEEIDNIINN